MMYRLLTYPLNVALMLSIALILSLLDLSYFYETPSSEDILYILTMILSYSFIGIFLNRYRPVTKTSDSLSSLYLTFLIISAIGFAVEFVIYGAPILLSTGRENYGGIPVLHVVFYSSSMASVLFASLYSGKRAIAVALICSFCISALLLSRQMMMVTFVILILSIATRYRITKAQWVKTAALCVGVIFVFGLIGNIRQQLAGDYVDNYILTVGGANSTGAVIGAVLYWPWLYIASPLYNLILNLNNYLNFSDSCNQAIAFGSCSGDYISAVIMPNTISKYFGAQDFVIDMKMAHLNAGTAFSAAARILGGTGISIQIMLQVVFYAIGCVLVNKKLRVAFTVYFSVLSLFMIFDNLYIHGEFFFVFVLIFISGLYLSKKPG